MTSRGTAVVVTVAVVAGATVAAVGLATRGATRSRPVLRIDEVKGSVGRVVLGETEENVVGVLGPPLRRSVTSGITLVYPRLSVGLRGGRVVSIETDDPGAQTDRVVRVGDPMSAIRALYRKASDCVPNSPDKTAPHPHCVVTVPAGKLLVTGDPIHSMTLVARAAGG
jgi:hypothetical protein